MKFFYESKIFHDSRRFVNKIVVSVTHNLLNLKYVDYVIFLGSDQIAIKGFK